LATVVLVTMAPPVTALAQATGIRVLKSDHVSVAEPKSPHYETYIAVHPKNPKHIIAVSMVTHVPTGKSGTNVYVTFDGGTKWTQSRLDHPSLASGTDGVVYLSADGIGYLVVGTRVVDVPKTVISRSVDGGRTWPAPTILPYRDRPWL